MVFEIKHHYSGAVLFSLECGSLKLAVEAAVKSRADLSGADLSLADLSGANLSRADLSGANLSRADLSGANLSLADLSWANLSLADLSWANLSLADLSGAENLTLPTGETWKQYLTETVPALLMADGKSLQEVANKEAFICHSWDNCPMAVAFGVHSLDQVPILHRPRAEQFIQFFDAKQIPLAVVAGTQTYEEYVAALKVERITETGGK